MDAGAAADGGVVCPDGQVLCGRCMDAFAPTAEAIQERIFVRSCGLSTACHRGGGAQEGLMLSSLDELFASAVGRPARQAGEHFLIAPGAPEQSYLVKKLRGVAAHGTAMPPPPSAPLCEAKIAAIEAWIRLGATGP